MSTTWFQSLCADSFFFSGFVYGRNIGGVVAKCFSPVIVAVLQLAGTEWFRPMAADKMTQILYGFVPAQQLSTQNSLGMRAFKTRVGTALLIDVCALLLSPICAVFLLDEGPMFCMIIISI